MSILDAGILISKIADVLIEHGGILHDLPLAVQRQPVLVHRIVVSAPLDLFGLWTYGDLAEGQGLTN